MDNGSFQLKRSGLALLFQLAIFAVLMALLHQLLPVSLWCGFLVLGAVIYLLFYRKAPKVTALDHLDGREWTLSAAGKKQRVQISHMIDHQAYIVLYFQHARAKPVIVWRDQVALKQWKAFKVLAKML